jgi:hypothetical protein
VSRRALKKLQEALDKHHFKINDVKVALRGPLTRMKNSPGICPFCNRSYDARP